MWLLAVYTRYRWSGGGVLDSFNLNYTQFKLYVTMSINSTLYLRLSVCWKYSLLSEFYSPIKPYLFIIYLCIYLFIYIFYYLLFYFIIIFFIFFILFYLFFIFIFFLFFIIIIFLFNLFILIFRKQLQRTIGIP